MHVDSKMITTIKLVNALPPHIVPVCVCMCVSASVHMVKAP